MGENKHKFYRTISQQGREMTYSSPARLLEKAYEYFDWCDKNPYIKPDLIKSGSLQGDIVDIPVGRPYTLTGLCVYCGITLDSLEKLTKKKNFVSTVSHIRNIISMHQIEGAMIGNYSASLVSRLLDITKSGDEIDESSEDLTIKVALAETKQEIEKLEGKLKAES